MIAFLTSLVAAAGSALAAVSTTGCLLVFFDEPEMPKSMIER